MYSSFRLHLNKTCLVSRAFKTNNIPKNRTIKKTLGNNPVDIGLNKAYLLSRVFYELPSFDITAEAKKVITKKEVVNIGIVGGGITGLLIADYLKKHYPKNFNVTILESTERVGGRIKTHKFKGDEYQYVDVGAMRIPELHIEVLDLIKDLDLNHKKIEYYFEEEEYNLYYINKTKVEDGTIMTKAYMKKNPDKIGFAKIKLTQDNMALVESSDPYEISIHLKKYVDENGQQKPVDPKKWANIKAIYDAIFEELATKYDEISDLDEFFKIYDHYSVESYIRQHIPKMLDYYCETLPSEADKQHLISSVLDFGELDSTGTGLNRLALCEGLLDYIHFRESTKWYTVLGGLEEITKSLEKRVKKAGVSIKLNTGVFQIDLKQKEADQVVLHYYNNNNEGKPLSFDRVVVTAPFASVRRIDINPGFTYLKTQAIRSFNYDHSTKVCLQVPDRFWEIAENRGGQSRTDLPLCNVVYPSYPNKGIPCPGKASFIASYTWQNEAVLWANMDDNNRIRLCLRNLKELHGVDIPKPKPDEIFTQVWHEAFAMFGPGQYSQMFKAMLPEDNVHFAGEHLTTNHAWIVGCISSAIRALREILVLEGYETVDSSWEKFPDGKNKDFTKETWKKYMDQVDLHSKKKSMMIK